MLQTDELTGILTIPEQEAELLGDYVSQPDLTEALGCRGERALLMRLCLIPRPRYWRLEIAMIAHIGGVEPEALDALLTDAVARHIEATSQALAVA